MSRERGSITIVSAVLLAATLLIGVVGLDLALVLRAASAAQGAADAAALAAAHEMAIGARTQPSDRAADYAIRNGATMLTCECAIGTWTATVTVSVEPGDLLVLPETGPIVATSSAVVDLPRPTSSAGPLSLGRTGPVSG